MKKFLFYFSLLFCSNLLFATPDFVEHNPSAQVYSQPAGSTSRSKIVPREGEAVDIWIKIGYSFYYTDVAIYYTTNGVDPAGSKGNPLNSSTQVLSTQNGGVSFQFNQPNSPNIDWLKGTLPSSTRLYNQHIKYVIGAWHSSGGNEIFANNYGCSTGTCSGSSGTPTIFDYFVKLAWPGGGSGTNHPTTGYPDIWFWKEEAVVGNNYMNVQLDRNGSVYDMYYPSAGCVHGMGTKNEGYVDGLDTFPPGLPTGDRGQMNINEAMSGIRVDGVTYWLTNENGSDFTSYNQTYINNSNVLSTNCTLTAGGNNIQISQIDFCPKGITYPLDNGGAPIRGIYGRRHILSNSGFITKNVNFYFYGDFALNGGDSYDNMFVDQSRGAMVAYDNVQRLTSSSGEYNPTTTGDYNKGVSIYLAASMKLCSSVGSSSGTLATEFWSDTSKDYGQGWIGVNLTLQPGESKEIDVIMVGGFDNFPNATGTYSYQIAPALDWFASSSMAAVEASTTSYWQNWINSGVTVTTPDSKINSLFTRGLLGTALHLDGKNGGVVAGMHNGAYPFVWPRDAVYAAITLDRTGHTSESAEVYRFLKDIAYRGNESYGKGFWYQKYSTDGYIIWSAPQVDETACVPWGVNYHYNVTGDQSFLSSNYNDLVYSAARASSETSTIDNRLFYDAPNQLMHSNNVWEDSFDDFIYSNAQVERGLRDAANLAYQIGNNSDSLLFTNRAQNIHQGLIGRLQWDGENTDISQLGIVYPFYVFAANDPFASHVVDRMNGVAVDRYGNNHSIMNFTGEFQGLINRYYNDTYWNGGPWFLSTVWYGMYYADRANYTPGKNDIDNHKTRLDLLVNRLGPVGFGAEQIAPTNSLLYPGQSDFTLQAAWPNAWESMSTLVDAVMKYFDFQPNALSNTIIVSPKLPTGWATMSVNNLPLRSNRINLNVSETSSKVTHTFTNVTGGSNITFYTTLRLPVGMVPNVVKINGTVTNSYSNDPATNGIMLHAFLSSGTNSQTVVEVTYGPPSNTISFTGTIVLAGWVGNNLPQTVITVDGSTQTVNLIGSGNSGSFTIQIPAGGLHTIKVKPNGFLAQKTTITTAGNPVSFTFNHGGAGLTPGDVNNDNFIDDSDLLGVINNFLSGPPSGLYDTNGDGIFDDTDLLAVINNFLATGDN